MPRLRQVESLPPGEGALPRYRRVARAMAVSDALCLLASFLLGYALLAPAAGLSDVLSVAAASAAWPVVFRAFSLYNPAELHPAEEFRRLIAATGAGLALLMVAGYWFSDTLSRPLVVTTGISVLLLELTVRRLWRWRIGRLKSNGRLALRTIIVGTNDEAHHLAKTLRRPGLGYRPLGYLAHGPHPAAPNGLPVLGGSADAEAAIDFYDADCLFVASSGTDVQSVQALAKVARRSGVLLRVSAALPETLTNRLSVQPVGGVMTLSVRPVQLSRTQAVAKRAADVALSVLGMVLLTPFAALVAALIRLTSPGPVFYTQERVGRRGEPFTMYKFRTMVNGADAMKTELSARNEASGPLFKMKDDPRVTRVGRRLRAWSLDELPQLINVLRGDMSLVGPRPPLPSELADYSEAHFDRLEVRPGITGLWQVSGRSSLTFDDYVRLDLFYIENWSLAYDLFILLKTLPAILSRKGAY